MPPDRSCSTPAPLVQKSDVLVVETGAVANPRALKPRKGRFSDSVQTNVVPQRGHSTNETWLFLGHCRIFRGVWSRSRDRKVPRLRL